MWVPWDAPDRVERASLRSAAARLSSTARACQDGVEGTGEESVLGRNRDAPVPSRPRRDRRTHRDPARDHPGLGRLQRRADGGRHTEKTATSVGYGGAVSTVDPEASAAALDVLKQGGNATDAAVAAAATLGVTEPYSSGIGGGGYFVHYDAATGQVLTIDGRETAPASMPHDAFIDPSDRQALQLHPSWSPAASRSACRAASPPGSARSTAGARCRWAAPSARPSTWPDTASWSTRRSASRRWRTSSASTPSGRPVGSSCPAATPPGRLDLPQPGPRPTYRRSRGAASPTSTTAQLGRQISRVVHHPPKTASTTLPVPTGFMQPSDLRAYRTIDRRPTHVGYRGYDVYGMAPSSSGGSTVGEALNILERYDLAGMSHADALHHYLEASALAFADRGAYVGDPAYVDVPLHALLSDRFAAAAGLPDQDATARCRPPVAAGDPRTGRVRRRRRAAVDGTGRPRT